MSEAYTGTGTLADGNTVILDEPLHLPSGRVRVIVELLPDGKPEHDWLYRLHEIRRSLRESGYCPRTAQEIDEQIRAERESWDR